MKNLFVQSYTTRDSHFGNARTARSLFEKAKLHQSNRLAEDEEADLFMILPEDIEENS